MKKLSKKYGKQLLDTGINASKTASRKVIDKAAEATGGFLTRKIADEVVETKHIIDENSRNVE